MTDTKALVERVREKARDLWAVAPSLASSESDRQTWADLNAALSELEAEVKRLTVALDATVTRAETAERERDEAVRKRDVYARGAREQAEAAIAAERELALFRMNADERADRVAELEEALREIADRRPEDEESPFSRSVVRELSAIARAALGREKEVE